MDDIYEQIWNSPGSHVTVRRPGQEGEDQADMILDQQEKRRDGECTSAQARQRPLLGRVNEALFAEPSFATFIALLNNYALSVRNSGAPRELSGTAATAGQGRRKQ